MFMKGYCIEGPAREPDLKETPDWALKGQIQRGTTGGFPTTKIHMKMTETMRSSVIRK